MVFSTGGDWDSTTLHNNGEEVMADKLLVELHAGRDEDGNATSGGLSRGGEATAYILPQGSTDQEPIFPGNLRLTFPNHALVIENSSPTFAIEMTQVNFDGQDVSNNVLDLMVNIDSVNNEVTASLTLYKAHWFSSDEVATYALL